jgi:hypothetical protein
MRILNPIKTYRDSFVKWKQIVKFNRKALEAKGFLINWISQLGLIVELTKEDLEALHHLSSNKFQYEIAQREFMNSRIRAEMKKHNDFFLDQGLLELIDDDFVIENSPVKEFTYYVTLSFKKHYFSKRGIRNFFLGLGMLTLSLILYSIFK